MKTKLVFLILLLTVFAHGQSVSVVDLDTNQSQVVTLDTNQVEQIAQHFLSESSVRNDHALRSGLVAGFTLGAVLLGIWWVKGMWKTFLGGDSQDD